MTNLKVLHCMMEEPKFLPSFIETIKENFDYDKHFFVVREHLEEKRIEGKNIFFLEKKYSKLKKFFIYSYFMNKCEKIILHGLFHKDIIKILYYQPWLLKKCYWIVWGGDLYGVQNNSKKLRHKLYENQRNSVIKNIGNIVTYIKGDYELVQKRFDAIGEYKECFMYTSNIYHHYDIPKKEKNTINIMMGNSAAHTNNHFEIFEKLLPFKEKNILIYCPLSYGGGIDKNLIIKKGKELFGDKFIPLTEFMIFEDYLKLLSSIDIAIYAHKRQQAMGNTITLLGLGKKVYMKKDTVQWDLFENIDVKVYDINNLDINLIHEEKKSNNQENIKKYFSKENYLKQLENLFESK